MKFIKAIFSRTALLLFLVLIQLAALIFGYYLIEFYAPWWVEILASIALMILEVLIVLVILNRDDAPDFKTPWFIVMIFLPILGVMCYIFFANHGMRRKYKKHVENIVRNSKPYNFVRQEVIETFTSENLKYANINRYLNTVSGMRGWDHNKVTYYKNGETFFPDFIKCLKEAKEFIFLEFFIINHGKEWEQIHEILKQKVTEGVEVRLIYDDFGCANTLKLKYCKQLNDEGIRCFRFNKFIPILNGVFNNRDHRKIAIIDHKYGFTGGMNLADEYANDIVRFGYWKDSMIKIEGPAIINLLHMFFQNWDMNAMEITNYAQYLSHIYKPAGNTFVFPFGDGPRPFFNDMVGEETFINMFNAARKSIYISTPYLIPTFALNNALITAAKNGLDVNLIVPGVPDKKLVYMMARSRFRRLLDAGVKIYTYTPGFNHQKSICIDNELAFVGTINLDYRSLVHHYECGAIIYKGDVIQNIQKDMEEMIAKSNRVPSDFKLNWLQRMICAVFNIFAALL